MNKRNTLTSSYEVCSICHSSDDEIICIINSLQQQITSVLLSQKNKNQGADFSCSKLEPLDFTKLLKMVFNRRFKNVKATSHCKHSQLKKTLASKIGSSDKQLDHISSIVAWKIAKFNFHTDTILAQSKTFMRHLTQVQQQKQSSGQSSSPKKESQCSLYSVKQENWEHEAVQQVQPATQFGAVYRQPQQQIYDNYPILWHVSWQPAPFLITNTEIEQGANYKQKIQDQKEQQNQQSNIPVPKVKSQQDHKGFELKNQKH